MGTIMKVVGIAGDVWIKGFDVDAVAQPSHLDDDGDMVVYGAASGSTTLTDERSRAMVFPDVASAAEAWCAQGSRVPLRADGLPNRPNTAFSVQMQPE